MLGHMVEQCHFHFLEVKERGQAWLASITSIAIAVLPFLIIFFFTLSALARLLASVTEMSGRKSETKALQVAA